MLFMPEISISSGAIFVCDQCGKEVRVDYDFEPIGDKDTEGESDFLKSLGQQNLKFKKSDHYDRNVGICEKCYEAKFDAIQRNNNEEIFEEILSMIDSAEATQEEIISTISKLLQGIFEKMAYEMTADDILSVTKAPIDPFFGDKHTTVAKRQQLLKNVYVKNNASEVESYIFRKAKNDATILSAIEQWKESTLPLKDKLNLMTKNRVLRYFATRTDEARIYRHPIWFSNMVTLKPNAEAPKEIFFFEEEIDRSDIKYLFDIQDEIGLPSNARKVVRSMMIERLEHMVNV